MGEKTAGMIVKETEKGKEEGERREKNARMMVEEAKKGREEHWKGKNRREKGEMNRREIEDKKGEKERI